MAVVTETPANRKPEGDGANVEHNPGPFLISLGCRLVSDHLAMALGSSIQRGKAAILEARGLCAQLRNFFVTAQLPI